MELLSYLPAVAVAIAPAMWATHRLKGNRTWWEAIVVILGGGGPGLPK